jgi:fluoride exporter
MSMHAKLDLSAQLGHREAMNSVFHPLSLGLVALGGGLGAVMRFVVSHFLGRLLGTIFPWGTFSVNIIGGLAMGLVTGWFIANYPISTPSMRLFLTTGVLGGFTTFSAFSLEMVDLIERGQAGMALAYAFVSVFISVAAVFGGLLFAKSLL